MDKCLIIRRKDTGTIVCVLTNVTSDGDGFLRIIALWVRMGLSKADGDVVSRSYQEAANYSAEVASVISWTDIPQFA